MSTTGLPRSGFAVVLVLLFGLVAGCENGKQLASNGNGDAGDVSEVSKGSSMGGTGSGPPLAPLDAAGLALAKKITKAKCDRCHKHDEKRGLMQSPGFLYTKRTLPDRLTPEAYGRKIEAMKKSSMRHFEKSAGIIEAIQAEPDMNRRLEMWLTAYLHNPKFDHRKNRMLKVSVADEEIAILARYIMNL